MPTFTSYGPSERLYQAARKVTKGSKGCSSPSVADLRAALKGCDEVIKDRRIFAKSIRAARAECNDDLEIDVHPVISQSDEGCWVSAWVWVPK